MVRDEILRELKKANEPLSGQMLADRYHVSRNAVWKAICSLKKEGYDIQAVGRKGYLLKNQADVLSAEEVRLACGDSVPSDLRIFTYDSIDSTNREAERALAGGFTGSAVFASESQTNAKAHANSSFESPRGAGIYFTLLLPCPALPSDRSLIGKAAAVAAIRAIHRYSAMNIRIGKVSSLCGEDGRKFGGILCEAVTGDLESDADTYLIIGIGIRARFNAPRHTSGLSCTRSEFISALLEELLRIDFCDERSYMADYERASKTG